MRETELSIDEIEELMAKLGLSDVVKRINGDLRIMAAHLLRLVELANGKA